MRRAGRVVYSHGRRREDPVFENTLELIEAVTTIVLAMGFAVETTSVHHDDGLDVVFTTPAGETVAVQCSNRVNFDGDPEDIETFIHGTELVYPNLRELIFVRERFPASTPNNIKSRNVNCAFIVLSHLASYILKYQPEKPKKQRQRKTIVGKKVQANREAILLAIAAVKQLLLAKIADLAIENRNDLVAKNARISEYQDLLGRIEALEAAVEKFTNANEKEATVEKPAMSFRQGLEKYWEKEHMSILSNSFMGGMFTSMAVICTLAGVNPVLAVATGLFLKPELKSALKVLPKKWFKNI